MIMRGEGEDAAIKRVQALRAAGTPLSVSEQALIDYVDWKEKMKTRYGRTVKYRNVYCNGGLIRAATPEEIESGEVRS